MMRKRGEEERDDDFVTCYSLEKHCESVLRLFVVLPQRVSSLGLLFHISHNFLMILSEHLQTGKCQIHNHSEER